MLAVLENWQIAPIYDRSDHFVLAAILAAY